MKKMEKKKILWGKKGEKKEKKHQERQKQNQSEIFDEL